MLAQTRLQSVDVPGRHGKSDAENAAVVRPTAARRRYLAQGLSDPGSKLPLCDHGGRKVPKGLSKPRRTGLGGGLVSRLKLGIGSKNADRTDQAGRY
jgi:hypothetical protein